MLVSDGIRYCTVWPVLGSSRTTRSVLIVEAQSSPFLSKLARYGNVYGGKSESKRPPAKLLASLWTNRTGVMAPRLYFLDEWQFNQGSERQPRGLRATIVGRERPLPPLRN